MTRKKRRNKGRPYSEWPAEDRRLWERFCDQARDPFVDHRECSDTTLKSYVYAYSLFLGFLDQRCPDLLQKPAAERVSAETAEEFIAYLRENCREKTVGSNIERLANFLMRVHPDADWKWLLRGGQKIRTEGQAREKRIVLSDPLLALGHKLMDEAIEEVEQFGVVLSHTATKYRDGLMIAVLSVAPMRRGPLAKLEIGRQVRKAGEIWRIDVPEEETKTHRREIYELSPTISKSFDLYLEIFRPEIPGALDHAAVWASRGGKAMSATLIAQSIERRTLKEFGFKVSPHRFRDAAATAMAVYDPKNVRAARDLLSHKSFSMTERYYIRAHSFEAGRKLIECVQRQLHSSELRNRGKSFEPAASSA